MAFRIDISRYQPLYTPLAIFAGGLVIAAAIYSSGGITIGGGQKAADSPSVAGEEGTQPEPESTTGTTYDSATLDRFAKCLTERGVKLYTADWCSHCTDQKELFGSSLQYLDHTVCAKGRTDPWSQVCIDAGIQGVPAWVFKDGSRAAGTQTLEALSEKAGCPLE